MVIDNLLEVVNYRSIIKKILNQRDRIRNLNKSDLLYHITTSDTVLEKGYNYIHYDNLLVLYKFKTTIQLLDFGYTKHFYSSLISRYLTKYKKDNVKVITIILYYYYCTNKTYLTSQDITKNVISSLEDLISIIINKSDTLYVKFDLVDSLLHLRKQLRIEYANS